MRRRRWLAPLLASSLIVLPFSAPASAQVLAYAWTTTSTGAGYFWDTYPYSSSPGWYISIYDDRADGQGVRMRQDYGTYVDYHDNVSGAGSEDIYWSSSSVERIQACNRDKLSNGTIRVLNCSSWVSTGI
ncbi:hypothetical protein [Nonomuraea sp. NPDC001023]|uniref:hypothetical protein n=1 Tax=unclassified Nonomuraea TaxID=2593643 RepID=UPI003325D8D8